MEYNIPVAWVCLTATVPLYFFLYLYMDAIIPDTYGIAKGFCFCLKRKKKVD